MAQMEIKKMKQGMSYSCKEKTIILNVFKYFKLQFPDICVTELVRRTAKATGCSEKSIFQFRKEETSPEGFKTPSTTKIRRNININSRDIKYDNNVRQAIRNIIYDLKYKNIIPSLNTILKQINSNPSLPNFSLMTLRRLMFDMGFSYEKNGNKFILVEKPVVKKESSSNNKLIKKQQQKQHGNQVTNSNQDVDNIPQVAQPLPPPPPPQPTLAQVEQSTNVNQRLMQTHIASHSNQPRQPQSLPQPQPQPQPQSQPPPAEPHIMPPPPLHLPLHQNIPPMMMNHRIPPTHIPPPNMNMGNWVPHHHHHHPHFMMKAE